MSYQKYICWIISPIIFIYIVVNGVGVIYFYYSPSDFYFRAWEYFEEVVYQFDKVNTTWRGKETSDLTRKHLFYYQDPHETLVSTDDDGFRSVPFKVDQYPVVVSGQSMIFGSGLSDSETLPWLLSKKLNMPIFNGGRSSVYNVLKKNNLRNIKLVIQCKPERVLTSSLYEGDYKMRNTEYISLRKNYKKNIYTFFKYINSERYLITSIIRRTFLRAWNDVDIFIGKEKVNDFLFASYHLTENDLNGAVNAIIRQRNEMESKGIRYIFTAIPSKQTLYATGIDSFTMGYLKKLHNRLDKAGVENIRMYSQFDLHKDEILYRRYDTHWNVKGTKLAADIIASYLRNPNLDREY